MYFFCASLGGAFRLPVWPSLNLSELLRFIELFVYCFDNWAFILVLYKSELVIISSNESVRISNDFY